MWILRQNPHEIPPCIQDLNVLIFVYWIINRFYNKVAVYRILVSLYIVIGSERSYNGGITLVILISLIYWVPCFVAVVACH